MAAAVLTLNSIPKNAETCLPNLMPFKVSYSGPAAISTFMNIKPAELAEPEVEETSEAQEPSSSNLDLAAQAAVDPAIKAEAVADHDVPMPAAALERAIKQEKLTPEPTSTESDKHEERFVSVFRGRIIQGLTVNLPEGYGGLVLRSSGTQPTASVSKTAGSSTTRALKKQLATKGKPRGRLTRSAASNKRVVDVDEPEIETIEDEDEDGDLDAMNVDEPATSMSDTPAATKNLVPSAHFSSFVVWRPDNPVAEIQDEYIRSMQEWSAIAAEIHRSEDMGP
ncbi:ribonuclease H2, subunit C [Coprinopsis sp. MPI-PUGE-AT-0042]|nr:ribonuclease H2, subunit C [Coprinopsis sp. MPI-PUGE-AT-0042]